MLRRRASPLRLIELAKVMLDIARNALHVANLTFQKSNVGGEIVHVARPFLRLEAVWKFSGLPFARGGVGASTDCLSRARA